MKRIAQVVAVLALGASAFWLGRITGGEASTPDFPPFTETVGITSGEGEGLAQFLDGHIGDVVFIDTYLDLSVSMTDQSEVDDRFQVLEFLEDSRRALPLSLDGATWLEIEFVDDRIPPTSHGGTGIVMAKLVGYFRVSQSAGSGPSLTYHLREIPQVVSVRP